MNTSLILRKPEEMFTDFGLGLRSFFSPAIFRPLRFERLFSEKDFFTPIRFEEKKGSYVFTADLPGLDKKDIKVSIDKNVLKVIGEHKEEKENKKRGIVHSESSYRGFSQSITLPKPVDVKTVKTSFDGCTLTVTIPQKHSKHLVAMKK